MGSKVLPEVQLLRCAFRWNQALWRKVQELGLQTAYTSDQTTNKYIRRVMQPIRKNNDTEGWHHGLKKTAADRCGLPLDLLHKEARLVSLQIRLVSESKLKRMQRATYCQMQSGPSDMWEVFNNKQN